VTSLDFRYRAAFAYVDAHLPDGDVLPLIRLRYSGSARHWGFGPYLPSSGRYENQILPNGFPSGSPEEALGFPSYRGDIGAPRGAWSYPRCSREELGGRFLALMQG
jgi:hypothetical protein